MMKKISVYFFILFPLAIASVIFFGHDESVSENENRTLKTRSDVTFNVADGGFQDWLEDYLSDQFPMRDALKQAEIEWQLDLGAGEVGGAYIGEDYRLFQKITEADVDRAACIRYAKRVNRLAADTELPTYVMYVPSAGIALRDSLPQGAPMYDYDSLYAALSAELKGVQMIDVKPALSGHPAYYYGTDHHWTAEGGQSAYQAWCQAHETEPDTVTLVTASDTFQGTLYSKVPIRRIPFDTIKAVKLAPLPDVEADGVPIAFYEPSALAAKDKYNYFQGGNHGITVMTNPEQSEGKTLLLLKDSFANSFVPYLIGDYHKIIMVDERYAFVDNRQLVKEYGVDEIAVVREIVNS